MLPQKAVLADSAAELACLAGLDLDDRQIADLRELMHVRESGKWRWDSWSVLSRSSDGDLVAARVLAGFLLLGERVLWSAQGGAVVRYAFGRVWTLLAKLGQPAEDGRTIDVDGVPVKVRYANGDEGFERLDTGARIWFLSRRYPGAGRGLSVDLNVVDQAPLCTAAQREQLLPTLVTRPNPQIIYI